MEGAGVLSSPFVRLRYTQCAHNTCTQNKRGLGLECIMRAESQIDTLHLYRSAQDTTVRALMFLASLGLILNTHTHMHSHAHTHTQTHTHTHIRTYKTPLHTHNCTITHTMLCVYYEHTQTHAHTTYSSTHDCTIHT